MNEVQVFVGIVRDDEELAQIIKVTYDDDGDEIFSDFLVQIGLKDYEPMCIERNCVDNNTEIRALLDGASYSDSFIDEVSDEGKYNACVLFYTPNAVSTPKSGRLKYIGVFHYKVT